MWHTASHIHSTVGDNKKFMFPIPTTIVVRTELLHSIPYNFSTVQFSNYRSPKYMYI